MASEWRSSSLDQLASVRTGKLDSNHARLNGAYPFFTCAPTPLRIDDYAFDCEAILLAGNNANGVFHLNRYCGKFNAYQRTYVITSKNTSAVDIGFLFYTLKTLTQRLGEYSQGTATKFLTMNILTSLPIPIPPLSEQRAIAHILGTLDDKIELNRRMNETLEAMARAIFKSWFVDFDPVRAKAEGHQPFGMDAPTAALFPDSLEDSRIGRVPKDWKISRIGDELTTVLGGTPARENPRYWMGGTIPWINSGKVNEFRIVEPSECITEQALGSSATKVLPKRTTVLAITGATLGQVSLLEIESCANQSVVGVLGSETVPSEYVYFWIKSRIDDLVSWQTGGAQQHINKNNVNDLPMLSPPSNIIGVFIKSIRPLFDLIKEHCFENLTLGSIRDALLPKLISGEIRVKDA